MKQCTATGQSMVPPDVSLNILKQSSYLMCDGFKGELHILKILKKRHGEWRVESGTTTDSNLPHLGLNRSEQQLLKQRVTRVSCGARFASNAPVFGPPVWTTCLDHRGSCHVDPCHSDPSGRSRAGLSFHSAFGTPGFALHLELLSAHGHLWPFGR